MKLTDKQYQHLGKLFLHEIGNNRMLHRALKRSPNYKYVVAVCTSTKSVSIPWHKRMINKIRKLFKK